MNAIRVEQHGGPEVLRYREIPDPEPGEGEVLLSLRTCGVNFIDVYYRSGAYPAQLPFTPGQEGAGVVVAVGPSVSRVAVGDRVVTRVGSGAYAELLVVHEDALSELPDEVDYETAAAVYVGGLTAHYLACSTYPLEAGQTCLVHAAAGGVGQLLVQIAKLKGARVIGTVSTRAKAKTARHAGVDEVVLYEEEDFVKAVRLVTAGEGVSVVYDSVGQATFAGSLQCLGPRGYLVLYGQSSGRVQPVDPADLAAKGITLTRPTLSDYLQTREELEWRAHDVWGWVSSGLLRPHVEVNLPLRDAHEAHRRLEARESVGQIVLRP